MYQSGSSGSFVYEDVDWKTTYYIVYISEDEQRGGSKESLREPVVYEVSL